MKYWKNITIDLPEMNLNDAMDKLLEMNILSVTILDKREVKDSDWFHDHTKPLAFSHKTHQISILIDDEYETIKLIDNIKIKLNLKEIPYFVEKRFKDQDWNIYTQSQFNEIIVSKSLRIIPPWLNKKGFEGNTIIIQPGSGFGTGTHPTTRLCLKWLERNDISSDSLLDFGSGSGVLGITAKKLGASFAEGIEIDPKAIDNANHNAMLNGVDIHFHKTEESLKDERYDNVVANILSDTIVNISPKLKKLTRKRLALSGILIDQVERVIDTYSDWICLKVSEEIDNWVLLDGKL
ncbi:MAG: 50S ribosomal protein L11 methyltransferase [Candidatus Neomarinimicrobiota bacterium]